MCVVADDEWGVIFCVKVICVEQFQPRKHLVVRVVHQMFIGIVLVMCIQRVVTNNVQCFFGQWTLVVCEDLIQVLVVAPTAQHVVQSAIRLVHPPFGLAVQGMVAVGVKHVEFGVDK